MPVEYPSSGDLSKAFYMEAIRHLEDAAVLLDNLRYAASITSSMKAAELAVKAAAIKANAFGFWSDLFKKHNPVTAMDSHTILKGLVDEINGSVPLLSGRIKEMEKLEPKEMKAGQSEEINTEYPFLRAQTGGRRRAAIIESPQAYFGETDAITHYSSARDLIDLLPRLRRSMSSWRSPLPGPR